MTIGRDEGIPKGHFNGQAHITGSGPNGLESIMNGMFSGVTRNGETSEDLNIWISPTGQDEDGDGSEENPYQSPTRAFQDVPFRINHPVHLRFAPGVYNDCPSNILHSFGANGFLALEAIGVPEAVDGPFTVTSYEGAWDTGQSYLESVGAGWTPNEFYNKWVRITSGEATGFIWPVYKNTADRVYIPKIFDYDVGTILEFEILEEPPVTCNTPSGVNFCEPAASLQPPAGTLGWYQGAKFAIAGIKFIAETTPYSFTIRNVSMHFAFCVFQNPDIAIDPYGINLDVQSAYVNYHEITDPTVFDNVIYSDKDSAGLVLRKDDTPYTGSYAYGAFVTNSWVERICSQYMMIFYFSAYVNKCAVGTCWFDPALGVVRNTNIDPIDATWDPVMLHGRCDLWFSTVQSSDDYGIFIWKSSAAYLHTVGDGGGISTYGVWIDTGGKVVRNSATTITGATADYYFRIGGTSGSYPASGSSVNDGNFGYIVTT